MTLFRKVSTPRPVEARNVTSSESLSLRFQSGHSLLQSGVSFF